MMMIWCFQTVLLFIAHLVLSDWAPAAPPTQNSFFYSDYLNESGNNERMHIIAQTLTF